jgi:glycosyltransferase involved in cell wall biosynthesis
LYNAIKLKNQPTNQQRHKQKVIFTGTLDVKKGIFQLMKAWNLVQHEMPGAQLYVYGKGKIEPCLQFLDRKVMDTVHFKGHVARELLLHELSTATLSVFPSYSETFGVMCIEALSVGCPVIFTVRSSGPEIIQHRVNGLLVEPDRVMEISGSIIELLKDVSLQKQFSEKGLETVREKFNIEQSARDHVNFYERTIAAFEAKKTSN